MLNKCQPRNILFPYRQQLFLLPQLILTWLPLIIQLRPFTVNMTDKQRSGTPVLRSDRLPEVLQLLATQVMDKALSFDEALREGTKNY